MKNLLLTFVLTLAVGSVAFGQAEKTLPIYDGTELKVENVEVTANGATNSSSIFAIVEYLADCGNTEAFMIVKDNGFNYKVYSGSQIKRDGLIHCAHGRPVSSKIKIDQFNGPQPKITVGGISPK